MTDKPRETDHQAESPPTVPVGLDAYRSWYRWPYQRLGVRAYMRSTYDRTGHNRTADASHYLYQQADDFNVTLDVEGQGVLYFVRTNRWHGSPWHYEIDGTDHIVAETTTADPLNPLIDSVFEPEGSFPKPLAYTYATTKGADLSWVPIPFGRRLRLAHTRTYYGTGYYIYHLLAEPSGLRAWDPLSRPDAEVLALIHRAGGDIVPDTGLNTRTGRLSVPAGETVTVAELNNGPAMLRKLRFSAPAARAADLAATRLIVTWDDRPAPSIDAPLSLFHGAGTLRNPDGREWLVKALPVSIRFADDRVHLACYIPMPFFRRAKLELLGPDMERPIDDIVWSLATEDYDGRWNHVGYLHATYRDHGSPAMGHDLEFLDTDGIEGAAVWSGALVGTSFIFTDRNVLTTLEGDPRFFFDDSLTPQVQGTGTEEWGGGGDYWGGQTMSLPLAGHPTGVVDATAAGHPDDLIHSAYRFLIADLMPFGKRARICFEHGGENESLEHYQSVTYWYGLPSASLVLTDTLDVGNPASEAAHGYVSPQATEPYSVRSRYEWGPDHLPAAIAAPLAEPRDYIEFDLDLPAGTYHLWIETRVGEELFDASLWAQFDGDVGTSGLKPEYMGSMGIQNSGRTPGSYRFVTGRAPASTVRLASGPQRLRLQPRHGRMIVSRILLSPHRSLRPPVDVVPLSDELLIGPEQLGCQGAYALVGDIDARAGRAVALTREPDEVEIFPARTMTGRRTHTYSEFTLEIRPDNHGLLLRRTLDYRYANQRAHVSVEEAGRWRLVGTWYLAGSNTVYHSFPWVEGELAPVRPKVITSNRRFRDDEFLIPARFSRGKAELRFRVEFSPRNPPLLRHQDPAPSTWTEFAYHAYSYVMPRVYP